MNNTVEEEKRVDIQKMKTVYVDSDPPSPWEGHYSAFSLTLAFTSERPHLQLHSLRRLPPGCPLLVSYPFFFFFFFPNLG